MVSDLDNIKSRAKFISQYFEIRDAETRQILISTHTNNPEGKLFNDVIDNYVNNDAFKALEIKLGNSQSDSNKSVHYVQAAGYDNNAGINFTEYLNTTRQQNGVMINGFTTKSKSDSVEDIIANKLAAYDAQLQERLLKEKYLSMSKELELRQEFAERELKIKQAAEADKRKVLEEQLNKEREERAMMKDIGRGAMEVLAGIGKEFFLGKTSSLSGIGNNTENKNTDKPKESPINFKIVNQNNPPEEKKEDTKDSPKKDDELMTVLAGVSGKKKELLLKIIAESEDEDFVADLEDFMNDDSTQQEEVVKVEEVE